MDTEQVHGKASRTQLDADLARKEQKFASDPLRSEIIGLTRRFKAGWIDLAAELSTCQKAQVYTKWGYASFEDYFRKELRLTTATVNKLVGTHAYLKKAAPDVLQRDGATQELPSLAAIDFLRRAEQAQEDGKASRELVDEVRRAALEDNISSAKLNRQFGETLFPADKTVEERKALRRLLLKMLEVAEALPGLSGVCARRDLPELREQLRDVADCLDTHLRTTLKRPGDDGADEGEGDE